MAKPVGSKCNLRCKYCYYLSKELLYPDSDFHMGENVLREYIQQYIESQRTKEVVFVWQGGEPTLLGIDYFQKIIEIEQEYCPPEKVIKNSLQTNGTLLNEEWCRFFKKHNFLIGISIDGPASVHDCYRVYKNGNPTHERIVESIRLLTRYNVDYNILCCVQKMNWKYPREVYRYFRNVLGATFFQFIPIIKMVDEDELKICGKGEKAFPPRLTEESITGYEFGHFLTGIFDEWIKRDVGRVFVQTFDNTLACWYGQSASLCVFTKTCGDALVIEHNGDVYSCDHFVYARNFVDNILEKPLVDIVASAKQSDFKANKFSRLPSTCKNCIYLFLCYGGCPRNRLSLTEDGEPGLNNLCEGYRMYFSHTQKAMKFMVQQLHEEKAPADVMGWMKRNKTVKSRHASVKKKRQNKKKKQKNKSKP